MVASFEWTEAAAALPEDGALVLVALNDDGDVWTAFREQGEWRYADAMPISLERVTHWMALPPSPAVVAAAPVAAVPAGWKLVPIEPTPEIIAGAAIAAWPVASPADVAIARKAAPIVLMKMDATPGVTADMLAATLATMAPAYRAMLAAAPSAPAVAAAVEGFWKANVGSMPVPESELVDVEFVNGQIQCGQPAFIFDWARNSDEIEPGWEIIRWRPAAPAPTVEGE